MDEYADIIRKMTSTPQADLPAAFTDKVMERIMREPEVRRSLLWQSLTRTREPGFTLLGFLSARTWFALCYVLSGLMFATMGGCLLIALADVHRSQFLSGWITTQPLFLIASSLWLVGLGAMLYFAGRQMTPFIKIGSILFIVAFLCNGFFINVLPSLVVYFFTTLLNSTAVVIGLILYRNVSFYAKTINRGGA